jgi:hypothetical protein
LQIGHILALPGVRSGVRPGPSQVAMPAEKRAAWEALWADVKATLADARKPAPPPTGSGKK